VINQATVYFPSVPEITPTNAVVNLVQPIVGKDQQVNTKYSHAVSFQVSGISAAPGALTYQISQQTVYGTLSGTLPNLTYTPMAGFSGSDTFYFTVSNGLETSLPAQVRITVQASKLFIPMVRR